MKKKRYTSFIAIEPTMNYILKNNYENGIVQIKKNEVK